MVIDIGEFLFKGILKMYEYPAAPFSGIIINDLVMFFLIPTIFIILILYMAIGRLVAGHAGLRLLVGLGAYLFIIFGGYYGVFARIAGPYFIFLIFVLGLFYFFIEHFSRRPAYSSGGGYKESGGGFEQAEKKADESWWREIKDIDNKIRKLEEQQKRAEEAHNDRTAATYAQKILDLEARKRDLTRQHKPWERY